MNTDKKNISLVCAYRSIKGLTLKEMACEIGLAKSILQRMEEGNFSSGKDNLRKVASYLGITIDDLVRNNLHGFLASRTEPAEPDYSMYKKQVELNVVRHETGLAGEKWTREMLLDMLKGTPYENSVISFSSMRRAGFDLFTLNAKDGTELYIEVKSTKNSDEDFYISANEVRTLSDYTADNKEYIIIRVYNAGSENCHHEIITGEELLTQFELIPCTYIAKRRRIA